MENSLSLGISIFVYRVINTVQTAYAAIVDSYSTNAKIKSTIKELQMLTDRELNDIGITRADIPFIARSSV